MKRYRMKIQVLSPVHIGSGEEVDPMEYIIKDNLFYRIDLTAFLQTLSGRLKDDFYSVVNSPNVTYLRKFLLKHIDPEKYCLFIASAERALIHAYEQNLENPRNQLLVTLMTHRGGDYLPYLPGSSIKGALRTAVVSVLANAGNVRPGNPRRFENDVLGHQDGKQDPFRCVKIADAILPANATFIDKVEIFKLDRARGPAPAGIQMFYEQCYSFLDGEDVEAVTTLDIDDQLPQKTAFDKRSRQDRTAVSMKLSARQIIDCCRKFYLPKIESEYQNFYKSSDDLARANAPLLKVKYADNQFPIRMGRFSHIECTTVDNLRQPGGAAARRGYGKTRTLSAGLMALGWAKVTLEGQN